MAIDLLASLEHVEVASSYFGIVVQAGRQYTAAEHEVEQQHARVDEERSEECPLLAVLLKPCEDQATDDWRSDGTEARTSKHHS